MKKKGEKLCHFLGLLFVVNCVERGGPDLAVNYSFLTSINNSKS